MMPVLDTTIEGFSESLQFRIIVKTVTDHEVVETSLTPVVLWFDGHVQPLHDKALLVKPEGERKWKWWTLWTDLELEVDDVIVDRNGREYRVMKDQDWSQSGFHQYQLIEGPSS